jgi:hypothetical protein
MSLECRECSFDGNSCVRNYWSTLEWWQ